MPDSPSPEQKIIRKCDDKENQPNLEKKYRFFTLPIEQIPEYKATETQVLHHSIGGESSVDKAGLYWKCIIPPMCDETGKEALKAKYIAENATDDSSTDGKLEGEGASIQVLVNNKGCAYWFPLEEKLLIEELKFDAEGKAIAWKERKIFVITATEDPVDKYIEVTECPTSTPSPE